MSVRRTRPALVALAAVTMLALTAPGATAAPIDPWSAAGYLPPGCGSIHLELNGDLTFTDTTVPRLRTISFWRGGVDLGRTIVVGPAGLTGVTMGGRITDDCAGAGVDGGAGPLGGIVYLRAIGTSTVVPMALTVPTARSTWDTVWRSTPSFSPSADNPGSYTPTLWASAPRYSAFTLTIAGTLVAATPSAALSFVVPDARLPITLLRASALTQAVSRRSVPRGTTITVSGVLTRARAGGYLAVSAGLVSLQRRVGNGAWRTVAQRSTTVTGAVSFRHQVTRTAALRLAYAGSGSPLFTAPVASAATVVRRR